MIAAENNYTTTEREGLTMVYAVKKFRHYLLANKFIFFVDHQALLYLVNKPCATGRIVRWFVILLEFDFEVAVKKGTMHQREQITFLGLLLERLQRGLMMIYLMLTFSILNGYQGGVLK